MSFLDMNRLAQDRASRQLPLSSDAAMMAATAVYITTPSGASEVSRQASQRAQARLLDKQAYLCSYVITSPLQPDSFAVVTQMHPSTGGGTLHIIVDDFGGGVSTSGTRDKDYDHAMPTRSISIEHENAAMALHTIGGHVLSGVQDWCTELRNAGFIVMKAV